MKQAVNISQHFCRLIALVIIFFLAFVLLAIPAMASNTLAKDNQFVLVTACELNDTAYELNATASTAQRWRDGS